MTNTLQAALEYHDRGLPITLCPPGGKNPLGEGWSKTRIGLAWQRKTWKKREIERAYDERGDLNVGVLFGAKSRLVDFEVDSPEDEKDFAELWDGCEPAVTPTFTSKRGPHRLFRFNARLEEIGKGTMHYKGLEIKIGAAGKGAQSLLPPSISGGVLRSWKVSLDDCEPASLPKLVIQRLLTANTRRQAPNTETQEIACVSVSLCICVKGVPEAIAATVPGAEGVRHRRLFHFARMLKAIPSLAGADFGTLQPIVREWHRVALPYIDTKEFEVTWSDFMHAWENVKFAAGADPIGAIFEQAIQAPLPAAAEQFEGESVRLLVALCCTLQGLAGDKPFYLDCRTAGRLLGVSHVVAHSLLRLLGRNRVLKVTTPGTRNRATEFRYVAGDK